MGNREIVGMQPGNKHIAATVQYITGIAEELEALPIMKPDASTDLKAFEAWHQMISDKVQHAEIAALMTVPETVREALDRVDRRQNVLIGIKVMRPESKDR